VFGALEVTTGTWVYRLGRRCAADFIALLDQLLRAFPRAPLIVVICDNDSIHHARKVAAYLEEHPRLELLYGARYSPHDNPAKRIWGALKTYVANTAVTWPARLRQIHSFFRARSPDQMLDTAAPWTSPWLPPGYEQNFGMLLSFLSASGNSMAVCLPKSHPCRLSGMPVLVKEAAEAVASVDVKPVGCQCSVTAVDLRRLEPADILMSALHSLVLRISGITEGDAGGLSRVHERSPGGPRRLRARRDRSYGPCPLLEGLLGGNPDSRKPVTRLWSMSASIVV
jgi:hypothetical protein